MRKIHPSTGFIIMFTLILTACKDEIKTPDKEAIASINLKRGPVTSCGPGEMKLGAVAFENSCSDKTKRDFELGIAFLHSFEYEDAEKVFAKVIDEEPDAAIAYWGVAMANFHPLWTPPLPAELEKGAKAISIAQSLTKKTKRESDYIEALAVFYKDRDKLNHAARAVAFEKEMEKIYSNYPDDKEAAIFYALALNGAADPADKSYIKQKKAGELLVALSSADPDHPGVIHYVIHSYDNPELAIRALPAARRYASIAPSSAHAQHMPSHIFTRLGLWDEGIKSNLESVASSKCYAENNGIKGHWDEELHGMDYLMYSYLQEGANDKAKALYDYLKTFKEVNPMNFKVAYSFAAIPTRYYLENKMWKELAILKTSPEDISWEKFPWQKAIVHFAHVLGSVHTGKLDSARAELKNLVIIRDTLLQQKDAYKANQVQIQINASEAWILLKEAKNDAAIKLMTEAATMEDNTQKHPVTPGEVIPARELLGDMWMQLNKPAEALEAYEANLRERPNRFNGVYGAATAAEKSGDQAKAALYYKKLIDICATSNSNRPELSIARSFLKKNKIADIAGKM